MILYIPLAWLQLARQKVRFIVALAGIAFIAVLMFMQIGFEDALYSSATQVHHSLRGDIFLVSSQYESLTSNQSFPRNRLYQTLGFNGVESISFLYVQFAKLKNTENGQKYSIYVLGIEPENSALSLTGIEQNLDILKFPNRVLFDRNSRPEFGPIAEKFEQGDTEQKIEIFTYTGTTGYRVRVSGLFSLGPSFGVDGNLVVSDSTFLRIFQGMKRRSGMIDVGLITLKPGASIQKIQANLQASLPKDVKIFTLQEFIDFEKNYWSVRTPIGFTLNLMLAMGSVIGIVIVYQILYSNISSNLVAYATLKAIGYANNYLLSVVLQQALILAVLGYIPGFAISLCLYEVARNATRLPMTMSISQALVILISTILMCLASGMFAVGKMQSADPADMLY